MKTRCLFYDNPYLTQFEAKLLDWSIQNKYIEVILDQTAFYATSGGQPHDTGSLNDVEVLNVIWKGDSIVHILSKQYETEIKDWELVKGEIDWHRRFDHMQHHTGQHLLSRSFLEVIPEAKTVSFHLTDNSVSIDVATPKIRDTELIQIQERVNAIVFQDVEIKTYFTSKEKAAQMKLRKDADQIAYDQVRLVEIGDFDTDPCGGTHCTRSGEVGIVLIEDVRKAGKRGHRINFLCGWRALKGFTQANKLLKDVQGFLRCELTDIPSMVHGLQDTIREKEKQIRVLKGQLQTFEVENYIQEAESKQSKIITKIYEEHEPEDAKRMVLGIVDTTEKFVAICGIKNDPSFIIMARPDSYPKLDLREILKEGLKSYKGRGGGTEALVQAGNVDPKELEALIIDLEHLILQQI